MAHKYYSGDKNQAPRADYQESKKYIPSLEVGEYEQYKKKQIKKGGVCVSCSLKNRHLSRYRVVRSLPPGRGGALRSPSVPAASSPTRLQEEGEEAQGVRQLRRVSRLRGSRGQDTAQTGQESLVLHQELTCPRQAGEELQSAQAEVGLLQTAGHPSLPGRIPRPGGLEGISPVHRVPGQVLQSPQQLQEDVQVLTERLSQPRASPPCQGVSPGLDQDAREEVGVQRADRLGLHHLQQLHQRQGEQRGEQDQARTVL